LKLFRPVSISIRSIFRQSVSSTPSRLIGS
jgi:hypothetical protein